MRVSQLRLAYLTRLLALMAVATAFFLNAAFADPADPAPPVPAPTSLTVMAISPPTAGLVDTIKITLAGPDIDKNKAKIDVSTLRLRLNGYLFTKLLPTLASAQLLSFDLSGITGDKIGQLKLLGSVPRTGEKTVDISVGRDGGPDLLSGSDATTQITFMVFSTLRILTGVGVAIILLFVVILLAAKTNMLRDSNPVVLAPGQSRPFSLGKCQMAFWFVLLTASFLLVFTITHNYNDVITPQTLTLLGISGATAVGAIAIDASKSANSAASIAGGAPAPVYSPHTTLLRDLLTDENGWAFHRVQAVVWTLLLGAISIWAAYTKLSLPDFDNNLLGLMGIGSGVYLGFKWPEKPS